MDFPSMVTIVPEGKFGTAAVEHFTVDRDASRWSAMRAGGYVPEGRYAMLRVNGRLTMSDTAMERRTNLEVVRESRGNVLIVGLGLGMILHPILAKEEVDSITVVEKCGDVISLIRPTIHNEKLTIIEEDIYQWFPLKGTKYDCIYFDIWMDQSTDCLEEMKKLHLRFRSFKAKGGWMESWRRDELRYKKRRDKQNGWW